MSERKYEITYIIRPDIDDESKKKLVEHFDNVLKDNGAKVIDSKDWKKIRFQYEIKHYNEGIYHIINILADNSKSINEFDRLAKINDDILRHMIVRRDN